MKNKIANTSVVTCAITLILIMLVGATYAYFTAQQGGTTSRNVTVTSNTTDNLSFQISQDISFTVTQADFYQDAGNKDGYATATAILTPNNYTGAATEHYYLYLMLDSNPTVYSEENTNEDAELVLQLFDSNNQLVTLTGLGSQVTVEDGLGNNITGYDITGVEGKKVLLSNQTISASNNTATTQTWRVVITLINYDFNQNDNTGKTITGRLEMRKDALPDYVYWNDLFLSPYYGYDNNHKPETTYASYADLINANELYENYYGIESDRIYVRTTLINGSATRHSACLNYNNQEFCLSTDYHVTNDPDHSLTRAKLMDDLESTIGITIYDGYAEAEAANSTDYCDNYFCGFDDFHIDFTGNESNDFSNWGYIMIVERSGCHYCIVHAGNVDGALCGCYD